MRGRSVKSASSSKTIGLAKHAEYSRYEKVTGERDYDVIKERFHRNPYSIKGVKHAGR